MDRRAVLAGLGGAMLVGCATSEPTPVSLVYEVIDSYRKLDRAKDQYPVSRADIDGQPLAVLGVQVEGGLKGFVVWSKSENGFDYWHSSNGVEVVTQAGRLIRTHGFPQDQLDSRIITGVDPLGLVLDPSISYQVRRQLDYREDPKSFEADYKLEYVGDVEVLIMEQAVMLSEWKETVLLPKTRRKWKQLIQVDRGSGKVVRSIQHVGPKMRVILEVLKPPTL